MSTLPLEVHEVLEEEYRARYNADIAAGYEVIAGQEANARKILSACGVADDALASPEMIAACVLEYAEGRRSIADLGKSPQITAKGRTLLENIGERANCAIIDEALPGIVKAVPDYDSFEILEGQEEWARTFLCTTGEKRSGLADGDAIKRVLRELVNSADKKRIAKLAASPAITKVGRQIIDRYSDYLKSEDVRKLNRRIIDEAMCGVIRPLRDMRLSKLYATLHAKPDKDAQTALCISGGGIRSATFALGIIQGLASARVLSRFHYLSTVSGGGYIGSWLSSWIRRHPDGIKGVENDLVRGDTGMGTKGEKRPESIVDPEPQPLRHLRDYSNYLSPKLGITSADTWTLAALYMRNLMLNLLVLVPLLAAGLAMPRIVSWLMAQSEKQHWQPQTHLTWMLVFLAWGFIYLAFARPVKQGGETRKQPNSRFIINCVLPLSAAGTAIALFWPTQAAHVAGIPSLVDKASYLVETFRNQALIALALMTVVPWLFYYGRYFLASAADRRSGVTRQGSIFMIKKFLCELAGTAVGGATSAVLLFLMAFKLFPEPLQKLADISQHPPFLWPFVNTFPIAQLYVCLAVPLVLLVFFVQASVFVGLSGFINDDNDREWWGRAGAFLLMFGALFGAVSLISVFGPVFMYRAPAILASIGGLSGIAAALFGFSARTPANDKQKQEPKKGRSAMDAVSAAAVPLFAIVTLAAISLGTTWLIQQFADTVEPPGAAKFRGQFASQASVTEKVVYDGKQYDVKIETPRVEAAPMAVMNGIAHLTTVATTTGKQIWIILGVGAAAFGLSFLISVNKFSMHALYRNRLIRAYLGASRYRRDPDTFTGFDENDNLQMFQLRPELVWPNTFGDGDKFVKQLVSALDAEESSEKKSIANEVWKHFGLTTRFTLRSIADKNSLCGKMRKIVERSGKDGPQVTGALRNQVILSINAVLLECDFRKLAPATAALHSDQKSRLALNHKVFEALYADVGPSQAPGPLHIVNTALNLTSGEKLAWQQRQAESFTVSPLHCGSLYLGYRKSREYGGPEGISIGTAVTISGAAASPNMGYHSSPLIAFLLTLLNVRLGWWLGNPGVAGRRSHRRGHPWTSVSLLLKELTGQSNDGYRWVYLSDGGHFENLGLYEMVLRRCRYIVVSDAGADPKCSFDDLGNAIRKIRTDLGVPVDMTDSIEMFPRAADGKPVKGQYVAFGSIRYSAMDGNSTKKDGTLVYIKPGVYESDCLPRDVYNYAQESPQFPHEPTSDQFFSESQFESYRALGRHAVSAIGGDAKKAASVAEFVNSVKPKPTGKYRPEEVLAKALKDIKLEIKKATKARGDGGPSGSADNRTSPEEKL
jgi:hypothetical protein